ncbi:hypothetical protein [Thermomonospora catenispora]|uniref:hypothetical protein n=1 Tax=Thermomonospora catenispora TaxID=2493090 RepID=UPI00111DFCA4|nr:hypothetical protein [Thermomonospora catenispora]TNY34742.1 hypothetical protein EIO00_22175 [Thermomonospora catenispora]
MIILSGVLVVVAIGLLVAVLVAEGNDADDLLGVDLEMVLYISIAVSVVSALCLAVGVFLRREELLGVGASPARRGRKGSARKGRKSRKGRTERATVPAASASAGKDGASATAVGRPARVPDEALVHVIPGRKRYHLSTCRQVAGRDTEELTYVEAREEGFSPCTACMPDTALAARAATSASSDGKQGKRTEKAGTAGKAADEASASAADKTDAKAEKAADRSAGKTASERSASSAADSGGTTVVLDKPAAPPAPAPSGTIPSAWSPPSDDADAESSAAIPEQPRAQEPSETGSSAADPEVSILSGTKRYHSNDCALIEDIGNDAEELERLPLSEARSRGCTPCLVCQPDKARA